METNPSRIDLPHTEKNLLGLCRSAGCIGTIAPVVSCELVAPLAFGKYCSTPWPSGMMKRFAQFVSSVGQWSPRSCFDTISVEERCLIGNKEQLAGLFASPPPP